MRAVIALVLLGLGLAASQSLPSRTYGVPDEGFSNGFRSDGFNGAPSTSYGPPEGRFIGPFNGEYGVDPDIAGLIENIPGGGVPGQDFPILASVPETGFSCDFQFVQGYYADTSPEAACQVFHICQDRPNGLRQQDSFLCPNGSIFNQQYLVCDWWFNFDCATAESFYSVNELIGVVPNGDYSNGNGNGRGRSGNGINGYANGNGVNGNGNGINGYTNGNGNGYTNGNGRNGYTNGNGNGRSGYTNGNGNGNGGNGYTNGNGNGIGLNGYTNGNGNGNGRSGYTNGNGNGSGGNGYTNGNGNARTEYTNGNGNGNGRNGYTNGNGNGNGYTNGNGNGSNGYTTRSNGNGYTNGNGNGNGGNGYSYSNGNGNANIFGTLSRSYGAPL